MKVSIIGAGKVGVTLAHALTFKGYVRELVLVGRTAESALGDAMDLEHAQAFASAPTAVRAGNAADTAGSDVVVICASVPMPADLRDRLSLGPGNAALLREILPPLVDASPGCIILMVSNPVDVLTSFALEITGLPPGRVFGTGTFVDSARFRVLLSRELGIHPDDLRAYILGEHGGSQFPAMSVATAGGEKIDDNPHRRELFARTVSAGIEVFKLKGHTNFAIAAAAASVIEAIALDEKHTMPLSTLIDGYLGVDGVCLSVPVVVGRRGIERVLHPALNDEETAAFQNCAKVVAGALAAARAG